MKIRRNGRRQLLMVEFLEPRHLLTGLPIISEFMADNNNSLLTGSDQAADWIEIFNSGDSAIDLEGWHLTDDADQLSRWTFPSTLLEAGQHLVVFASSCEYPGVQCAKPAEELHTNFSLDAEGDYLALVQPDGVTVVSAYGPTNNEYERQYEDVSYGVEFGVERFDFVPRGATVSAFVPQDDSLGNDWVATDFDSSEWAAVQAPIGYGEFSDGSLKELIRLDFNDETRGDAEAVDTEVGFTPFAISDSGSVVNGVRVTISPIGEARLDDRDRSEPVDLPPEFTYAQLYDDFLFANRTFGSPGLQIELDGLTPNQVYGVKFRSYDASSPGDRVSTWTEVLGDQAIITEYSFDGADLPTDHDSHSFSALLTSSSDGRLVIEGVRTGGTSHGVFLNSLEISSPRRDDLIETDVRDEMYQKSSTLFARVPFLPATVEVDSLDLEMQFDAGFVAYLNGTEILRQNAPGSVGTPLGHDAVAIGEWSESELLEVQTFGLSNFIPLLKPGTPNVLAIQGLNSSADDLDFVLVPRLVASSTGAGLTRYFSPATPWVPNNPGYESVVRDTSFSHDRGFFDQPFDVEITTETPGATIIYTVDGSAPSKTNGTRVEGEAGVSTSATVPVTSTTSLRAMAIKDNHLPTNIDTQTYIFLDSVLKQDPFNDPNAPTYPTRWQANATADLEMDPEVVAQWDDDNPANNDFGIRESLKSIPTMSIVMEHEDLWGADGIYRDATKRGTRYRRAGSVEYFDPQTGEQFQLNAGVQMHGNASRDNVRLKKHSFRLLFKNEYGPGNLRFPLFEDTDNEVFNTLVLRAHFTDAFATRTASNRYSPMDSLYMRDVWMRNTQLAMGHPSTHNTYVHLYVNGLYWGIYNPAERPDDAFLSQYLGGEREDWDIVKDFNELDSGQRTAWTKMFGLARDLRDADNSEELYQRLQGKRADGSTDPENPALLDVDSLIDFMILHLYGGVEDWPHHNWYASRNRVDPGDGFRFYVWDQEIAIDGRFRDLTDVGRAGNHRNTPAELYYLLRNHVDSFNLRFADRVALHFAEGGALSLAANQARWDEQAAMMEAAIIAESARWGDAREGERITVDSGRPSIRVPTLTVDHWRAEVANVRDNYMPRLHVETLDNFRNAGLASPLTVTDFSPGGGVVAKNSSVVLTANLAQGLENFLIPEGGAATAFVPHDGSLDAASLGESPQWTAPDFDDGNWIIGSGGVGFEKSTGNGNVIGIDLLSEDLPPEKRMDQDGDGSTETNSFYSRFKFELDPSLELDAINQMALRMKFDDGFVAYLNGTKIVSENAPDELAWDSRATRSSEANRVVEYSLFNAKSLLRRDGRNVLAIQGMNRSASSSDLIISPELVAFVREEGRTNDVYFTTDGSDPRAAGGAIHQAATLFADNLIIGESATVTARGFADGVWGPVKSVTYVVNPAGPENLAITEVNYNPLPPTLAEASRLPAIGADDFEFIEIHNANENERVGIAGLALSDGVSFDFPDVSLAPNEFAVVVRNAEAFRVRYGEGANILGQWSGGLANSGERIALTSISGQEYLAINYEDSDPWPEAPDGKGASLELISSHQSLSEARKYYHWRSSADIGGSPGRRGSLAPPVTIHEVLTRPDGNRGQVGDSIELRNGSPTNLDIGGWYLSDSSDDFFKFMIPVGTVLPANGYVVFSEADFNPSPAEPNLNHFGLSSRNGDDVWLVVGDKESGVTSFVDEIHFRAARLGETFGRVVNTAGQARMVPMSQATLGSENAEPTVGSVVISEINYHPGNPSQQAVSLYPEIELQDLEYVELLNRTNVAVDLGDWELRGGVDIDLNDQILAAGESMLVLSFNPNSAGNVDRLEAFRAHYEIGVEVILAGGFSGQLGNGDDRVVLLRYDATIDTHVMEDEVLYDDLAPWPVNADGRGDSLTRVALSGYGNEPTNWLAAAPSPGRMSTVNADFNNDGLINSVDIDLLCVAVGTDAPQFDLNGDQMIDTKDMSFLLDRVLRVPMGDANLDGVFDSSDLVTIFVAGEFEDGVIGNSGWASGDWNCDREFDSSDLVAAFQAGSYLPGAVAKTLPSQVIATNSAFHWIDEMEGPRTGEAKGGLERLLLATPEAREVGLIDGHFRTLIATDSLSDGALARESDRQWFGRVDGAELDKLFASSELDKIFLEP